MNIPSRRSILALLAAAPLPQEVLAQRGQQLHRGTGFFDPSGYFRWVGGGRDPLRLSPQQVLDLPAVRAVMPATVAQALLADMEQVRRGAPSLVVRDGWRDNVMFSGETGWMANEVIAMPSVWPANASRDAWVAYAFDDEGRQWRMTFYRVCSNISFSRINAPVSCVCDVARGDACRS